MPEDIQSGADASWIGFQDITCHLLMDVKMDFRRKVHLALIVIFVGTEPFQVGRSLGFLSKSVTR